MGFGGVVGSGSGPGSDTVVDDESPPMVPLDETSEMHAPSTRGAKALNVSTASRVDVVSRACEIALSADAASEVHEKVSATASGAERVIIAATNATNLLRDISITFQGLASHLEGRFNSVCKALW